MCQDRHPGISQFWMDLNLTLHHLGVKFGLTGLPRSRQGGIHMRGSVLVRGFDSSPFRPIWNPGLNPQRPESYGHQPRPTPSAAPYQGDPWSQPPPTQLQQPQDASYGGWQAPRWANGVGSNMRPFDVRDWTVGKKASHELKSFNGDITNYDNWRRRVRDYFTSTNMFYKDMFGLI